MFVYVCVFVCVRACVRVCVHVRVSETDREKKIFVMGEE